MKARRLIITLASMAALFTVAMTCGAHRSVFGRAQEVEKSDEWGVTGAMDFIVEWVEPDSPTEKAGLKGFIVASVRPGSPAEKAGLRRGDAIMSLDGRRVKSMQEMQDSLRRSLSDSGNPVDVAFLRYDPVVSRLVSRVVTVTPVLSGGEARTTGRTETIISGRILNDKAIEKPLPTYPEIARAARASGTVTVNVIIDEEGRVEKAKAVSGHPLLQSAAVEAAYQARFSPTLLSGNPVKVSGEVTYNFVLP